MDCGEGCVVNLNYVIHLVISDMNNNTSTFFKQGEPFKVTITILKKDTADPNEKFTYSIYSSILYIYNSKGELDTETPKGIILTEPKLISENKFECTTKLELESKFIQKTTILTGSVKLRVFVQLIPESQRRRFLQSSVKAEVAPGEEITLNLDKRRLQWIDRRVC